MLLYHTPAHAIVMMISILLQKWFHCHFHLYYIIISGIVFPKFIEVLEYFDNLIVTNSFQILSNQETRDEGINSAV